MARVLVHAINGSGLGHVRRAALVAAALRRVDPDGDVLVISEAVRNDMLAQQGLRFVTIPVVGSVTQGEAWSDFCRRLLFDAVGLFKPDLVLHDTHFLKEVVRQLSDERYRQAIVMRFTSAVHLRNFFGGGSVTRMQGVLMPYERNEVEGMRLSAGLRSRLVACPGVEFVGPIVGSLESPSAEIVGRYELDRPDRPVLVSAGGGGKPGAETFYRLAYEAACVVAAAAGVRFLFVLGPLCRLTLEPMPGIMVVREEPRLRELLPLFAAAIVLPGYNTLRELMVARIPAIAMANPRLYCEDQMPLLSSLEALGCVKVPRGRRSLEAALREVTGSELVRARMAEAWPDLVPRLDGVARLILHLAGADLARPQGDC